MELNVPEQFLRQMAELESLHASELAEHAKENDLIAKTEELCNASMQSRVKHV
jgi:hypothetical protein